MTSSNKKKSFTREEHEQARLLIIQRLGMKRLKKIQMIEQIKKIKELYYAKNKEENQGSET